MLEHREMHAFQTIKVSSRRYTCYTLISAIKLMITKRRKRCLINDDWEITVTVMRLLFERRTNR